ncbi:MAG: DNA-deoxyinosine glycosylase [Proteobacteria bacterium]|nr:DNA-deoxyinosine glycosylase [Pseudomonadota bacterium]
MPALQGFAPIARPDARVLILGSMPGAASLQAHRYYAHPQNRFWPIMGDLLRAGPDLPYGQRCRQLSAAGVAVWDVLARCEREGSLDSAIRDDTAQANDFATFFARHPAIGTVLFNGAKAESSFRRMVLPQSQMLPLRYLRLPSTSPANASQRQVDKLAAWREGLRAAGIAVCE